MKNPALERAMELLKKGDKSAFDYIYERTYKLVFFAAHSVLKNSQSAEDIVQETYIAAYRHREEYKSDNLAAWLTTIARRLAINEFNRGKRDVFTDFSDNENQYAAEDKLDKNELGLIGLAERVLTPTDFQIVVMYAVQGYKRREIAEMLNMPTSTVTYRYSQAIKTLEKEYSGKGGGNE